MGKIIPFRLRDGKDDDLIKSFDELPKSTDKSDIIRDALRRYFYHPTYQAWPVDININQLESHNIELKRKEKSEDEILDNLDKLLDF